MTEGDQSEDCKGCVDFGSCAMQASTFNGTDIIKCPCINCLVKMVCKYGCKDWLDYEEAYFKIHTFE